MPRSRQEDRQLEGQQGLTDRKGVTRQQGLPGRKGSHRHGQGCSPTRRSLHRTPGQSPAAPSPLPEPSLPPHSLASCRCWRRRRRRFWRACEAAPAAPLHLLLPLPPLPPLPMLRLGAQPSACLTVCPPGIPAACAPAEHRRSRCLGLKQAACDAAMLGAGESQRQEVQSGMQRRQQAGAAAAGRGVWRRLPAAAVMINRLCFYLCRASHVQTASASGTACRRVALPAYVRKPLVICCNRPDGLHRNGDERLSWGFARPPPQQAQQRPAAGRPCRGHRLQCHVVACTPSKCMPQFTPFKQIQLNQKCTHRAAAKTGHRKAMTGVAPPRRAREGAQRRLPVGVVGAA